mmetsp:Transcript_35568/g.96446  ORF Transcript_35568/g.96446 Transcript_35568/m.96446 type:complete len:264 (-) Transcript_35568:92-883(-)
MHGHGAEDRWADEHNERVTAARIELRAVDLRHAADLAHRQDVQPPACIRTSGGQRRRHVPGCPGAAALRGLLEEHGAALAQHSAEQPVAHHKHHRRAALPAEAGERHVPLEVLEGLEQRSLDEGGDAVLGGQHVEVAQDGDRELPAAELRHLGVGLGGGLAIEEGKQGALAGVGEDPLRRQAYVERVGDLAQVLHEYIPGHLVPSGAWLDDRVNDQPLALLEFVVELDLVGFCLLLLVQVRLLRRLDERLMVVLLFQLPEWRP